jgi:hypothetical protein
MGGLDPPIQKSRAGYSGLLLSMAGSRPAMEIDILTELAEGVVRAHA